MKDFQKNLLFFLSMGLCGLCAWQWYVQTALHNEGQDLQKVIFKQASDIQQYTNSIKNMDAEIAGLSTRINELKAEAMTHAQAATQQKREFDRLVSEGKMMSNEIVQYKDLVEQLDAKLKEAGTGIEKQNEAIKTLVTERDTAIQKYNDSVKERNALVEKYNDLVERVKKLQAANAETAKP